MSLKSTEVAYGFGQQGSGHLQAASSALTPPTGKVIIAIQFLDDLALATLVPETATTGKYIGTGGTANTANNSVVVDIAVTFPKGITLVGRWSSVTLQAASDHGIICYFGD